MLYNCLANLHITCKSVSPNPIRVDRIEVGNFIYICKHTVEKNYTNVTNPIRVDRIEVG